MRTIYYKMIFLLLLVPAVGFSGNDIDGRYTKEKKINRKFEVSPTALLKVNNSYGNIDLITWDQNRVEIEVTIKTNGNDEEKVAQRLQEIDVEFRNSASGVSAKTLFDQRNNSSWWSNIFGNSSNVSMEINYRIKAPVRNNVDFNNDYGNIRIDKLEGDATINCDYGRLLLGELRGNNNVLSFDYTRNSTISYITRAKINADYSEYSIEEAGTLDISADYSESRIGKVENIKFNCDYGSISIDKLRNLKGQGDYLSTKLGSVYNSVELELDYGSASIERVMKSLQKLDINSDYTSIKIGYDANAPFNYSVSTSYGGVKGIDGKNNFTVNKRHQSSGDNYYEGYHISSKSGAKINIKSSYGSVTFVD